MSRPNPTTRCPRCNRTATVKADGTLGLHYAIDSKTARVRCIEGAHARPVGQQRPGRRVTVSVEVVIPGDWSMARYKAEAARVLREQAVEGFVLGAAVADDGLAPAPPAPAPEGWVCPVCTGAKVVGLVRVLRMRATGRTRCPSCHPEPGRRALPALELPFRIDLPRSA